VSSAAVECVRQPVRTNLFAQSGMPGCPLMKIITKAIGVAVAATALCGLGVAAASAAVPSTARHTPNQLGDPLPFRVDLLNNSTSPLQITSYSGSVWDTADGPPAVGTTIAKGQEIHVFLYSEGGQ
jgi:hypothetical protein